MKFARKIAYEKAAFTGCNGLPVPTDPSRPVTRDRALHCVTIVARPDVATGTEYRSQWDQP